MDKTEVRARIERERSEQLDHSNKLLAIAGTVFMLIVTAVGAFIAYSDPFIAGGLAPALVPLSFLGLVIGKALTRIEARIIVSSYRIRGRGRPRDRLPLLLAMIQRGGFSLRVMADDIALDVVLGGWFLYLLNNSTGVRWFASALCAIMFLYTALSAYIIDRLTARAQADIIKRAAKAPSLERPDRPALFALLTISIALACYPIGALVSGDVARETPGLAASAGTLYASIAWTSAWSLLPTLSTVLIRRAADPTLDILHEIEEEFDATGNAEQAESDLQSVKLSRGQLAALPRTLNDLRQAYERASQRASDEGAP